MHTIKFREEYEATFIVPTSENREKLNKLFKHLPHDIIRVMLEVASYSVKNINIDIVNHKGHISFEILGENSNYIADAIIFSFRCEFFERLSASLDYKMINNIARDLGIKFDYFVMRVE